MPGGPFSHVHVVIVGFLPPSLGFTHHLAYIDCTTRWLEAIPLSSILEDWVACFRAPCEITSNQGAQLITAALWCTTVHLLGMDLHHTSAFHPQSNGLVK